MSDEIPVRLDRPSRFHGYSVTPAQVSVTPQTPCGKTAIQLHIGHLPNRKGLCLYVAETNNFVAHVTPLAYFKTEASAKALQTVLDWMILKIQPPAP